jgi:hypothetical protein
MRHVAVTVPFAVVIAAGFVSPRAAAAATLAVTNAEIHPIFGPVIPGGVLIADGGKIVAVGAAEAVTVPPGAAVVDAGGLALTNDAILRVGLPCVCSSSRMR